MTRKALTSRQHEFMDAICADIARGLPPTIRELGDKFGVSLNAAQDNVKALIRKGYLERDGQANRGIRIVVAKPRPKPASHDGPALTIISGRGCSGRMPEFHTVTEAG